MPVVVNISLEAVADVERSFTYCGNAEHKNHTRHRVETIRIIGDLTDAAFLERLRCALAFLNNERPPENQLRVAIRWWVGAFDKGSNLTVAEKRSYEQMLVKSLGCGGWYAASWHVRSDGAADLNIFDAGIEMGEIPTLRRSRRVNLLGRARARSDEWSLEVNAKRGETNTPAIPTPVVAQEKHRNNEHILSVEELLAQFSNGCEVTQENLPRVIRAIGLKPNEWDISLDNRFLALSHVPGRKKKTTSPIRFNLRTLIFNVNLRVKMREAIREEKEVDMDTGEKTISRIETSLEVILEERVIDPSPCERGVGESGAVCDTKSGVDDNLQGTDAEVSRPLGTAPAVIPNPISKPSPSISTHMP